MTVTLRPELEQIINDRLASGRYPSPTEVIGDALRLLKERDELREQKLEELRRELQIGIDQIERGEYSSYDEDSLEELAEKIKARNLSRLSGQSGSRFSPTDSSR